MVVVTLLSPTLAEFALQFGPPEYFALILLGFTAIGAVTGSSLAKGLTSVTLGLLISTIGLDICPAGLFTFGEDWLLSGFSFIVVAIGVFGIGEALDGMMTRLDIRSSASLRETQSRLRPSGSARAARSSAGSRRTLGRSSTRRRLDAGLLHRLQRRAQRFQASREFGKGAIEGVAAPESANNAASASAMIPLLTLGVPGSGTTAVLLGGFLLWGLRPGPLLFTQHPEFAWGLIASMYVGNVMLVLLNFFANPIFATMLWIPYAVQVAFVVIFAIIGAYSLSNNPFDVVVMIAFGVLGFAMKRLDYSAAGLILGLVLGPLAEKSLRQSLTLSRGDWSIFFTRPVSAVLMILAITVLLRPLVRKALIRRAGIPGTGDDLQYTGGEE